MTDDIGMLCSRSGAIGQPTTDIGTNRRIRHIRTQNVLWLCYGYVMLWYRKERGKRIHDRIDDIDDIDDMMT